MGSAPVLQVTPRPGETLVGLAYSPAALEFARSRPGVVDYLEIPFEQIRHTPEVAGLQAELPLILHCASLSVAGFVAPQDALVESVAREAERLGTPWVGEHLAFLSADPLDGSSGGEPTQLTYTICPQLSEEVLDRVVRNFEALAPRLPAPLILENSPQYLSLPGSTMTMIDFIGALVDACPVDLLLDLSHYAITAHNMGFDASARFDDLPLERVVEVHLSGHSVQSGVMWDDHAMAAPEASFDLLERLLRRARPGAVTFEYNWGDGFPADQIEAHVARARTLIEAA